MNEPKIHFFNTDVVFLDQKRILLSMTDCTGKYYLINDILKPVVGLKIGEIPEGFSIYEIVRVKDAVALFIEDHLSRLYRSLGLENLQINETEREMKNRVRKLIENNDIRNGKIKFVIHFPSYPKSDEYKIWLYFTHYEPPSSDQYRNGVETILCKAVRKDPNAKVLNTEARRIADQKIRESGVYEAVLLDSQGYVTEGSRSNIFFITGVTLVTPPDETVLQGIARKNIMRICREQGIKTEIRKIHKNELGNFDSAFLSGTTPKILPIKRIDGIDFPVENRLMSYLMKAYDERIERYISNRS